MLWINSPERLMMIARGLGAQLGNQILARTKRLDGTNFTLLTRVGKNNFLGVPVDLDDRAMRVGFRGVRSNQDVPMR